MRTMLLSFCSYLFLLSHVCSAQPVSILKGKWAGTLDQNPEASQMSGYQRNYYSTGAFQIDMPTHQVRMDLKISNDGKVGGVVSFHLTTDTTDFADFSVQGIFRNGTLKVDAVENIRQHLVLTSGYCYMHASLEFSEDSAFEYLKGISTGTYSGGDCAKAYISLKRKRNDRQQSKQDSPVVKVAPLIVTAKRDTAEQKVEVQPIELQSRANPITATYQVSSPEISLLVFDNGQIDGDIISVFHNGVKVLDHIPLKKEPKTYKILADSLNRRHEITLVAENLGSIPPNTALLRIISGKDTYELMVTSDKSNNARLVFEYAGN